MANGDRCSVFGCNNDRRYPNRYVIKHDGRKISFYRCPKPSLYSKWSRLINRKYFQVTKDSKVCSNHFEDGKPTKKNPLPSLYLKEYPDDINQRKRPTNRSFECQTINKKKRLESTDIATTTFGENSDNQENLNPNIPDNIVPSYNKENPPDIQDNIFCELNSAAIDPGIDHCYDNSRKPEEPLLSRLQPCPYSLCSHSAKQRDKITYLNQELQQLRVKICDLEKEIKQLKAKRFTIQDIEHSDKLVQMYTGLQNGKVFNLLADKLREKAGRLQYVRGSSSNTTKHHQLEANRKKPGPKRATTIEEEFFMTLVRLRQGLSEEDLAFRMKVSQATVSRIVATWIAFLSKELSSLIYWPTGLENSSYYPECFKNYPNVKAIIDCTEVYIQRPSLSEAQALTYSNYKSTNTWKTLVACTPAGTVSFIAPGQGGLASDRQIVEDCGIINKFEHNDVCMADRGFNIQDLLLSKEVKLVIPPFKKGQSQFSKKNVKNTSSIAKARIHIERVIGRIKNFRILNTRVPLTMVDQLDDIFNVCGALVNLAQPLIPLEKKTSRR